MLPYPLDVYMHVRVLPLNDMRDPTQIEEVLRSPERKKRFSNFSSVINKGRLYYEIWKIPVRLVL